METHSSLSFALLFARLLSPQKSQTKISSRSKKINKQTNNESMCVQLLGRAENRLQALGLHRSRGLPRSKVETSGKHR